MPAEGQHGGHVSAILGGTRALKRQRDRAPAVAPAADAPRSRGDAGIPSNVEAAGETIRVLTATGPNLQPAGRPRARFRRTPYAVPPRRELAQDEHAPQDPLRRNAGPPAHRHLGLDAL